RKITSLSILMQSINVRCNIFQTAVGIFLHAAGTPDTVIELLSQIGISVSSSTINSAIHHLSKTTTTARERMGRNLRMTFAYGNLEIDIKSLIPTVGFADEIILIKIRRV
ncbi:hypothetical protein AN958_12642, partial [Leucoagaricus sp. SymC.cos]